MPDWDYPDRDALLTLDEAVEWLHPPITREKLRGLVEADGVPARGVRRKLGPGRPPLTYAFSDLALVHAANAPLMHRFACATGA